MKYAFITGLFISSIFAEVNTTNVVIRVLEKLILLFRILKVLKSLP